MEAVLWGEGAEMGAKSVLTLFILSSVSCLLYLTSHSCWCCVRYDRIPLTDSDVEEELKDKAEK